MTWQGQLLHIHIAPTAGAEMQALDAASLVAGLGIAGDRYATGQGRYSSIPDIREVTLIEFETLEALSRDHQVDLEPGMHRRNLTTHGVPLNHLVGKEFAVGAAVLLGGRLNTPCRYLEKLTGKTVYGHLKNRSGLNCRILVGATIKAGDVIRPNP